MRCERILQADSKIIFYCITAYFCSLCHLKTMQAKLLAPIGYVRDKTAGMV